MEKFKEGHAGGRNFVVEEPKFDFKKPVFRKKIRLAKGIRGSDCKGIS